VTLICCVNFIPHAMKFEIVKPRIEKLMWLWVEAAGYALERWWSRGREKADVARSIVSGTSLTPLLDGHCLLHPLGSFYEG
jgi:hypothetical protein